jgi:hypothetical protein
LGDELFAEGDGAFGGEPELHGWGILTLDGSGGGKENAEISNFRFEI